MSDKGTASERRGTGLLPAGIIIAVLIAVAVFMTLRGNRPLDQSDVTSVVTPAAPDASEATAPEEEMPLQSAEAPAGDAVDAATPIQENEPVEEAVTAPSVDEVRVDNTGAMVIAGQGDPGSQVDVLVDGEVVTSAQVDGSGAFAALTSIPESDGARSLTLRSGEGDEAVASKEEIILAPVTPLPTETADLNAGGADEARIASDAQADVTDPVEEEPVAAGKVDQPQPDTGQAEEQLAEAEPDDGRVVAAEAEATVDAASAETEAASAEITQAPQDETIQGAEASNELAAAEGEQVPSTTANQSVAEPQADQDRQIAVLRSDDEGVTLVQPAAPLPDSVVLDTIGYNDDGVVQLAGRASGAAVQVQIYLDNRPVKRLDVNQEGAWRGSVQDVAPGVYRLRIDALTPEGRVASRIETPFKREAPAVLAAAASDTDGAGAVRAVTVQAGDTLWAIARERYGEGLLYVQVFEANRAAIRDPDLIYPGQVFELPND